MDRGTTEGALLIELGGREIEYRFRRRRRRTLGITIDAAGVRVTAPLRAPWRDIEAFLREKERWILDKLDEWARLPRPSVLEGRTGEVLPLFGQPRVLEVCAGRAAVREADGRLFVHAPRNGRPLAVLLRWLKGRALQVLAPRVERYAGALELPPPRLALSNARTQWGVCTERRGIRLSWRLVHVAPELADYVVAHEVAHLVEMNHSRRFWSVVERLYPRWREARERLELAGASLPVLKGRR